MNKRNISLNFIGVSVFLLLLDFQIFGIFTTNRLGFILFLCGFFLYNKPFKFRKAASFSFPILIILTINLVSVFFSTLFYFFYSPSLSSFIPLYSWTMIFIMVQMLSRIIFDKNSLNYIILYSSNLAFIFILFLFLYSLYNYGAFALVDSSMRVGLNEIGPGLSRLINGIVFSNILFLFRIQIFNSFYHRLISIISVLMSLFIILGSQSRQGLLLISLIFLCFALVLYPSFKYKKLAFIFIFAGLTFFSYLIYNSENFSQGYLDRTINQMDNNEGSTADRIHFFKNGLDYIQSNILIGIGPDNFAIKNGRPAHNGYITTISENGFLSLFALFLLILYILYESIYYIFNYKNFSFFIISLTIIISPLFNDIFSNPMVWCFLIINIGFNSLYFKLKINLNEN